MFGAKQPDVRWVQDCVRGTYEESGSHVRIHTYIYIYLSQKNMHIVMNVFLWVHCILYVCFYLVIINVFLYFHFQPLRNLDVDHGTTRPGIKLPLTLSFDYPSVQVQSAKFVTLDLILTVVCLKHGNVLAILDVFCCRAWVISIYTYIYIYMMYIMI